MAAGTVSGVSACRELSRMRVLVASEALLGSRVEIDVLQIGLERRRTMAIAAGYTTVSAEQGKFRFRMVKAVQLFPLDRGVARFATCSPSIRALRCHSLAELPFVWIQVAGRA